MKGTQSRWQHFQICFLFMSHLKIRARTSCWKSHEIIPRNPYNEPCETILLDINAGDTEKHFSVKKIIYCNTHIYIVNSDNIHHHHHRIHRIFLIFDWYTVQQNRNCQFKYRSLASQDWTSYGNDVSGRWRSHDRTFQLPYQSTVQNRRGKVYLIRDYVKGTKTSVKLNVHENEMYVNADNSHGILGPLHKSLMDDWCSYPFSSMNALNIN